MFLIVNGGTARSRTESHQVKSLLLYQLSYDPNHRYSISYYDGKITSVCYAATLVFIR